jgi:hypothetical protein
MWGGQLQAPIALPAVKYMSVYLIMFDALRSSWFVIFQVYVLRIID